MRQRPTAVRRAVQLIWLLVLLALVGTVLAAVFDDELVRVSGAAGSSADDTRVPPTFTPVVIVLFVTLASLLLVLVSFLLGGHNWARHCLAATVGLIGVGTLAAAVTGPPPGLVAAAVVALLLDGLILYFLYRPETAAYVDTRAPRGAARRGS